MMTPARPMNVFRRLFVMLAAAAALLTPVQMAAAQGTSGTLPDPISTPELDRYAELLDLSDQQRQAIEPMHSRYLEQFSRLRSDEVEEFLEEFRGVRRQLFQPSGFETVDRVTRDHRRLMSRIASLDESLFNQIQTVLSDEQTVLLPRARMARERERYRSDAVRFATSRNPGVRVDLSELTREVELASADRQAVDPVLARYERQLTGELKQMFDVASGMFEEVTRRMAEAGAGPPDPENPGSMRETFRAFEQAWREVNAEVLDEASDVSELNHSTVRAMAPLLSENGARTLRHRYYRRAYGTVAREAGRAERRISTALEMTELTDEQRSAVNDLRRAYDTQFVQMMEQAVDILEEQRTVPRWFGRGNDDDDPARVKLDAIRSRLSELDERTIAQLNELLGADLVAALEGRGDEQGEAGESQAATFVVAGAGAGGQVITLEGDITLEDRGPSNDPFLPGPISRGDLDSYLTRLGADDQQRTIIESLYAQYVDGFAQISEQYIDPLLERADRPRGRRDFDPPDPNEVNETFALRREGMQSILSLDDTFFDDVELLISDDEQATQELARVRQSRLRDVYNRGGVGGGAMFFGGRGGNFRGRFGPGGQEVRVDLTRELRDVQLDAAARSTADPILNEYAAAMTEALRRQYETALRHAEAMQQAIARAMQQQSEEGDDGEGRRMRFRVIGEEMRRLGETLGQQREQAQQEVVDLNRRTLEQLTEVLPDEFAQTVREAYYRAGYPGVYSDRNSAQRQVDTALNLRDLTAAQRSELIDIAAEYRSRYGDLCAQMVEAQMNRPMEGQGEGGRGGPDWRRMQDLRNELERLRFDRNELNEKTIRRLRNVLTDRQVDQVPGLTDDATDG